MCHLGMQWWVTSIMAGCQAVHTFSFGFGQRFQAACLLEYLGFWIPKIARLHSFWVTFWFSPALEFSCLCCTFAAAVLVIGYHSLPSSLPTLDLFPMDFFPTREHSFLTLVSFTLLDIPFTMFVVLLWIALVVVLLNWKWTPRCPDLRFLNFFACFGCFVWERMDALMVDFRAFGLLFCSCIVNAFVFLSSIHIFCCRCPRMMGTILLMSLAKRLALQVSVAKFVLFRALVHFGSFLYC